MKSLAFWRELHRNTLGYPWRITCRGWKFRTCLGSFSHLLDF